MHQAKSAVTCRFMRTREGKDCGTDAPTCPALRAGGSVLGRVLLWGSATLIALLAVALGVLMQYKPAPAVWQRTADFITLADGRNLSYLQRGAPDAPHTLFYIHG